MVEEGCDMFDLSHVVHTEYVVNGKVVVGRATSVDEAQGLVYVGLKGSLGAQGRKIYLRFLSTKLTPLALTFFYLSLSLFLTGGIVWTRVFLLVSNQCCRLTTY